MRVPSRVVIVAVAAITVAGVWAPSRATAARPTWDRRVLPVAQEVEQLRGRRFERPVPVEFLSNSGFEQRVTVDRGKLSNDDIEELARGEAQLRSIGLIAGDVDLVDALSSLQTSGVLAYYDPAKKRVTVRGRRLDPATKVTLAHELTHALQDQHFDLRKLQRAAERSHSSDALRALVEGDAVRVQDLYIAGLSSEERQAYATNRRAAGSGALDDARAEGVPDSLVVLFQSPYTLGPLMLQVVSAIDGESAIDELFRDPPDADSAYLTPRSLVDGSVLTPVDIPALAADEEVAGKPGVFGAFALYLMLASRSDPVDALTVADGWAGDAMVTFNRGATTCVRSSFAGRTEPARAAIGEALARWAAAGPEGAADVRDDGLLTTLTACDPGSVPGVAEDSSLAALTVVGVRNGLLATLAEQGVGIDVADCTATGTVEDPSFRPVLEATVADPNASPDPSILGPFQRSVVRVAARCAR